MEAIALQKKTPEISPKEAAAVIDKPRTCLELTAVAISRI